MGKRDDITITAICDGWSEERHPANEDEALMMASCMADSGKYEIVSLRIRGVQHFFRKHCTNVKYLRRKFFPDTVSVNLTQYNSSFL